MKIIKTLELNEQEVMLLTMNGMGMTGAEIASATGKEESGIAKAIAEAIGRWQTEVVSDEPQPAVDAPAWPPAPMPEAPQYATSDAPCAIVNPATKGRKPGKGKGRPLAKTHLVDGDTPATQLQYDVWELSQKGLSLPQIAARLNVSYCSAKMARYRINQVLTTKQCNSHWPQIEEKPKPPRQHFKFTKEGIGISKMEHDFARLYATGEYNLIQMAESLGCKLQAVHDMRYRLKNKLGVRDDIEFNYALRAIAEL